MRILRNAILFLSLSSTQFCNAQQLPLFSFQHDDSLLKKRYFDQSAEKKKFLLSNVDKKYASDYKGIYEDQFNEIGRLWQSGRSVTSSVAHN